MRTLSVSFVFCAVLSQVVGAQTSRPPVATPHTPAASTTKTIPIIKCVDRDTAAACNSFKQLINARDTGLLAQVLGTPQFPRNTSYVCLRPNTDFFSIVIVDIPEPKAYFPKLYTDEVIARYADDSDPTNAAMREIIKRSKEGDEMLEFTRVSGHPAVSQYTKDEWYRDHGKEFVYSFGNIFDFRYQDGMNMGPVEDWGEWTMLASNKDGKQKDPPTWFLGGYAWIEKFNREHGNQSAQDDDPEHGHISVDTTTVYVHYRYENGSNEMTDYTMHINRLTGRFVERFESPAVNDQRTGTCLVFK